MKRNVSTFIALCLTMALAPVGLAGPGHDHSHDHAAPTGTGPALPRFTAQSDLFDAVGILGKEELVIFIDRAATNEPVLNATVELESGSVKAIGKFEATLGEYHFDGAPFQRTVVYPITLTIKAGNDNDLLSADLDVHADEQSAQVAGMLLHTFRDHPVWVASALLLIVALVLFLRKKNRTELLDRGVA